jgi:hypothetical protein
MKTSRVAISHQLREILQHCQATDFLNFLTGNESWLFLQDPHHGIWAASRDEVLERGTTKIETEKWMVAFDQKYELQFSGLLSTCHFGDPAKNLLIEPQKHIERYSLAP